MSQASPPAAVEIEAPQPLVMGQAPGTAQRCWKTPSEFPRCPDVGDVGAVPIRKQ